MEANLFTTILLPVGLAIVLLSMDLILVPEDFQQATRYPNSVMTGLIAQAP